MKNKGIIIFLIFLALVITALVAYDYISGRPDKSRENPYAYSVSEFKEVPDEMIGYRETRNFRFSFAKPAAIAVEGDRIYLAGDKGLQVIDVTGKLLNGITFQEEPQAVEVSGDRIFIGFTNHLSLLDMDGKLLSNWTIEGKKTQITAIAAGVNAIFVADAGTRRVITFNHSGVKLNEFEGKANQDDLHGFIIPSPYFDLDINSDGELWVVNPGLHEFENYKPDGMFRTYWKSSGNDTRGFSGCCNPANFKFLPDGSYVTSEKGLVRIKIYKPSGEFDCVVAPPEKFGNGEKAPDIAVDKSGNIYALDYDKRLIRVFEKK